MNHEIFLDFVSDVPTALSGSTFRLWQYLIATKAGLELEESAKTNNADKFSKMLTFVGRHVEHLFSSDPISIKIPPGLTKENIMMNQMPAVNVAPSKQRKVK